MRACVLLLLRQHKRNWCYILLIPQKTLYGIKPRDLKLLTKIQFTTHLISIESSHTVTLPSYIRLDDTGSSGSKLKWKRCDFDRLNSKISTNLITWFSCIHNFMWLINRNQNNVSLSLQERTCCNDKLDILLWAMLRNFLSAVIVQRITLYMLSLSKML